MYRYDKLADTTTRQVAKEKENKTAGMVGSMLNAWIVISREINIIGKWHR